VTLLYLVLQGLKERQFRSLLIVFFILVLTGFLLATTVISRGVEKSLRTGMEKLGADIIVIPYDITEQAQKEVLAGRLGTTDWVPADNVHRLLEMEEVERASPRLHLATISGSPHSSAEELVVMAFDPQTDFTILCWLKDKLKGPLKVGEAIGGAFINRASPSEHVSVNGYELILVGKLDPVGIWYDQAIFVTFDTARDMKAKGAVSDEVSLETVTNITVDLKPGIDVNETAVKMWLTAPGIWPVQAPKLMTILATQRAGLIKSLFIALGIIWVLAVVLTGFVFSMLVNERRREIGMLRATGASRNFIFQLFLTESAVLACSGGLAGIILSMLFLSCMRSWLMSALEIQILFPSLPGLVLFTVGCFLIALVLVLPALLYPAVRASRLDPAVAMREV
jgi:putative ABC transport system permease protein